MTIKQLLYIVSVTNNNFNISETAEKLFTSQPGISKQIKLLEDSLSVRIFKRKGKTLIGLTDVGEEIIKYASRVLKNTDNIKEVSYEYSSKSGNTLKIVGTSAEVMFSLPSAIKDFSSKHKNISVELSSANVDNVIDTLNDETSDATIFSVLSRTPVEKLPTGMIMIPAKKWYPVLLVNPEHELVKKEKITLSDITKYDVLAEVENPQYPNAIDTVYKKSKKQPNIVIRTDNPIIQKQYIKENNVIGVLNPITCDSKDCDLVSISLKKIFPEYTTWLVFSRNILLRRHIYDFAYLVSNVLPKNKIAEIIMRADSDNPIQDGLTGAFLKEILLSDAQKHISINQPFVCLTLSIDNFYNLSDDYGYQASNETLSFFVEHINQTIRKGDRLYRLRDDIFIVILPLKGNTENAIEVIDERLSESINKFISGLPKKLEVSSGKSIYPKDSNNIHKLIDIAEKREKPVD